MPPLTPEMLVVFGVVAAAVVLFVSERISPDVTALAVLFVLVVLGPDGAVDYTGVSTPEALSGFSSPATITILAMYVLSAGVRESGAIARLGDAVASFTHGSADRLLGTTVGLTGLLAGVINNTPVVAMFIPMVTDLADEAHVSPSKLLIPLSYASMLGGVLTLIGTATNILASDIAAELGVPGTPFSMFQFTPLGLVVLAVGVTYLLTVAQRLLPERVPAIDLVADYELEDYLSRVYVRTRSPFVGLTVAEAVREFAPDADVDVLQVVRGEESFLAPGSDRLLRPGDVLTVRGDAEAVTAFVGLGALRRLPRATVSEDELADPEGHGTLIAVVVPTESGLIGQTLRESRFREQFGATVLAVRRGSRVIHEELPELSLGAGDGLLLHAGDDQVPVIQDSSALTITDTASGFGSGPPDREPFFRTDGPVAVAIVAAVVLSAALTLLPIVIAAIGGIVAMVVAGVVTPARAYEAVSWDVIFLLAGIVPLGVALQETGGAAFLAATVVGAAAVLPPLAVLGLFYLLTGLLANVVTPVASVALMVPVAVDAAGRLGASEYAFVLAVTFAGSTAFMTPIGYQTNLMVYSPGGYRFVDYVRVGAPLQALLAVVTPVAIDLLYGV